MPTKKRKKANEKIKTLPTKSLSAKNAANVRGGKGVKAISKASKTLLEHCATGKHIPNVIIE